MQAYAQYFQPVLLPINKHNSSINKHDSYKHYVLLRIHPNYFISYGLYFVT
ncbi:hypothetical protein XIS1_480116 [Xenorhabdus innexi]|uniref:Uncharacterized protein n=1 Tax=Xenorhabdus innexi TaxID=290109 RepID=A0A1N6MYV5_9GAMM|nr:hypothetical protein XIS1_480116 [Xenorhabdus innexi]